MKSRMERYYENDEANTRSHRNKELYKKVHDSEINQFNVNSNESVIGESSKNIDVDNLRQILDKKYRESPKRKSISLDIADKKPQIEEIKDEDKDYDINVILEKARQQKQTDYNEERLKKIRDTQFDILKGLNLKKEENEEDEEPNDEEKKLMTLINTITSNELANENNSSNPLDLLEDLKGNDDTKVLPSEEITKTLEIKNSEDIKKIGEENKIINSAQKEKDKSKELENSFFTDSIKLSKKDFEDFEDFDDLKSEGKKSVLKTILIIFIAIIIVLGILILVDKLLSLGLVNKLIKILS